MRVMAYSECKFRKILIANRSEIAIRIARTLKIMGIESHAIYSEEDRNALHVKVCDIAHFLKSDSKLSAYLNIESIIKLAKKEKIDAIHPGYGFLSENHEFAKKCRQAGITFIGPDFKAMQALGDKINAKKLAEKLSIPTLKIENITSQSPFPLVVKAAGGGGGRGMRIVNKYSDFAEAYSSAIREARSTFNNPSVYTERYLKNVRHIEVQVIADNYADVRHIFDRDCSLQRNHQKIIEEAPASGISNKVRERLYQSAIRLCKKAGYNNLATVEFLLDSGNKFYFLEVNTRLQVEHTVSEEISGLDFVRLQIEIASGNRLKDLLPEKLKIKGHAIQCRICAESPENKFLPSAGKISHLSFPDTKYSGIRIDHGIEIGSETGFAFDSMLAKFIVFSADRKKAVNLLNRSLPECSIHGILTNLMFLNSIIADKNFINNTINTEFIKKFLSEINWGILLESQAANYLFHQLNGGKKPLNDIWDHNNLFRIAGTRAFLEKKFRINNSIDINLRLSSINSKSFKICNRLKKEIIFPPPEPPKITKSDNAAWFDSSFGTLKIEEAHENKKNQNISGSRQIAVRSELPGKIIKIMVKEGQQIQPGADLLVIESMKMEHVIKAGFSSKIQKINVKSGDLISPDMVLINFYERS